ncbi:hypothetical protein [Mesorhizobium muleiense]|uniref:hypothetical protein n=1 Tax=Mesorhizobium muleiense TaxID=1004279 RepID=UPI001F4154C6|nr:hypothetical protein [Mesorhizobium muleiense]MCF6112011.1 hypothetical protein [Mesorhizobium muleiense]
MASDDLPARFLKAGEDYLEALRSLGLDPEGLLWCIEDGSEEHVLVLITGFLDQVGPLELSRYLFKAYNASATPREISPFIIRFQSPSHPSSKDIAFRWSSRDEIYVRMDKTGSHIEQVFHVPPGHKMPQGVVSATNMGLRFPGSGVTFAPEWIIQMKLARAENAADRARHWRIFSRNVDRLAA